MAVTNQKSNEINSAEATPPVLNPASKKGDLEVHMFSFAQSGIGDIGSTVDLVTLPPGRYTLVGGLSGISFSAFGVARTLDIGFKAYTDGDGNGVAAAANGLDAAISVAAEGSANLAAAVTGVLSREFNARTSVTIHATVAGGTIPDAATLNGHIGIVRG